MVYEDEYTADEWNVACTLELQDDGRFEYGEYWTCYLAAVSGGVWGSWSWEGSAVVLRPDGCEGTTFLRLPPGEERRAVVRGDVIEVEPGTVLRLRKEAPADSPPPAPSSPPLPSAPPDRVAAPSAAAGPPLPPEPMEGDEARRRAGLRIPSPGLAARIRELIAQLPAGAPDEGIVRVCRVNEMLPLATNSIYLWGLRPDGVMLCVDHESFSRRAEPETDPVVAYGAMMQGVQRHPELQPLVPERPPGVVRCQRCDGRGYTLAPGERIADACLQCRGLGWH